MVDEFNTYMLTYKPKYFLYHNRTMKIGSGKFKPHLLFKNFNFREVSHLNFIANLLNKQYKLVKTFDTETERETNRIEVYEYK